MRILLLACALVWAGCSSEQGAKGGPGGGGGNGGSGNSVGGSGGSGGKVGVGGEPGKDSGPMWSLDADPNDLTTDHAPDVRIAATDYYGMGAADFSQALSLRTHPADVVVPTSVAKEQSDAGPPPGSKAWVLHPTQTLTPGWYALVVAAGSGAFGQGHPRDDGGWESRFRIGSDPLLLAVEACASDDLTKLVKVRIDFSELVTLPASGTPIDVVVEGQPVSCAYCS